MRTRTAWLVLALVATLLACRTQEKAGAAPTRAPATHDLSIDERLGGHTLERHIARTDAQLQERLRREKNISAASTYTDRSTAEHAIAMALEQEKEKIQRWTDRGERRPNLVLDYNDPGNVLGRVMYRGARGSVPCDHAIVVLKADGARDYHVLTSYPECRP